jgi:hypothetical protein
MSDDYDDEDEPGGLWDPDAFTPPPAPARPALHIVATPGTPSPLDSPADATPDFQAADEHTLVRLEQFKPGVTTRRPSSHTRPAVTRRVLATGVAAMAVAATALGYTLLSPVERPSRPAPTQDLGAHVGTDAEQAAATRTVVSASSAAHNERRTKPRAERHTKSPRSPVARSPNHPPTSSAQRAPTTTASHTTTTTASTIIGRAARPPRPQASAATASSEFGFEG